MSAERIWELIARKLAGEASPEELHELELLLRSHPDLHFSVQTITDLWVQQQKKAADNDTPEAAWQQHLARLHEKGITLSAPPDAQEATTLWESPMPTSSKRKLKASLLAAAAIIIISVWTFYFFQQPENNNVAEKSIATTPHEITTTYGVRTTRQLPDGSCVWLNAGSKLIINEDFGESLREVTLTGEAFFDVAKNPDKPFIIHTPAVDIKVLGTQFNVKSYPSDKTTETSLLRGSVEVVVKKRPDEKYVLKPNEKLVVLNEEITSPEKNNDWPANRNSNENIIAIKSLTYQQGDTTAIEAAWVRNKLSVKDEPFIELARKMERWYDVAFEFRNKWLEEAFITGSFENETLEQALEALRFSFDFKYRINGKTVIIY